METKSAKPATIHERIVAIAKEVTPITKERTNQGQSYKFRGIDDVMNALQPLFAKHGVFLTATILDDKTEERTSKSGSAMTFRTIRMRYSLCCEDGSSVMTESLGEGCDSGDKSAAKSMSIALKYALLQLLMIPTEDAKDVEDENHDLMPAPRKELDPLDEAHQGADPKDSFRNITIVKSDGKKHQMSRFEVYDGMEAMKQIIGEDAYYEILQLGGYKKANTVPDAMLPKFYSMLLAKVKQDQEYAPEKE